MKFSTGAKNIASEFSLEKQKQDLLKSKSVQTTTGKTYQELFNEKWLNEC